MIADNGAGTRSRQQQLLNAQVRFGNGQTKQRPSSLQPPHQQQQSTTTSQSTSLSNTYPMLTSPYHHPGHSQNHHHNSSIKQSVSTSSSHRKNHKEWQKVLYKHQGVPDNYVPPTFLKDLRKNGLSFLID